MAAAVKLVLMTWEPMGNSFGYFMLKSRLDLPGLLNPNFSKTVTIFQKMTPTNKQS